MKTITCKFNSNGESITKTAVLTDDLSELSKSKKNKATDIIDDFGEDDQWSLYFEENNNLGYEIQLKRDNDYRKTLKPIKAITWEGGEDAVITDVQKVTVKVK